MSGVWDAAVSAPVARRRGDGRMEVRFAAVAGVATARFEQYDQQIWIATVRPVGSGWRLRCAPDGVRGLTFECQTEGEVGQIAGAVANMGLRPYLALRAWLSWPSAGHCLTYLVARSEWRWLSVGGVTAWADMHVTLLPTAADLAEVMAATAWPGVYVPSAFDVEYAQSLALPPPTLPAGVADAGAIAHAATMAEEQAAAAMAAEAVRGRLLRSIRI